MSDMLVKLYDLPEIMEIDGFEIRRAFAPERMVVREWVSKHFKQRWAEEADLAFSNTPISCLLAIQDKKIHGICCYDVTFKGLVGPFGVREDSRRKGLGKALFLKCLYTMYDYGYAYAIIGQVGPEAFYQKVCDVIIISDSVPGSYKEIIHPDSQV
jgi:GNAT superfamily N-acetyltransferase